MLNLIRLKDCGNPKVVVLERINSEFIYGACFENLQEHDGRKKLFRKTTPGGAHLRRQDTTEY